MFTLFFKAIKAPSKFFLYIDKFNIYDWMPDKLYLKMMYRLYVKKKLNINNPTTFNEKLQWLKLYDRNPDYTMMVDKYKVREYISKTLGDEYLIPLLGVWDDPDDINFDELPNQFVLKCNHNSGLGMFICRDKREIDIQKVKKELKRGLRQNYYKHGREWPYKNVERKIIAEKYMADTHGEGLKDYKFMCFNGRVECSFVVSERFKDSGLKVTFFDRDWKMLPFERHYPRSEYKIPKPKSYDKMIYLAEKLAKDMKFARIDFYDIKGRVYFGEITLFPGSGFEEFSPEEWDYKLGKMIQI